MFQLQYFTSCKNYACRVYTYKLIWLTVSREKTVLRPFLLQGLYGQLAPAHKEGRGRPLRRLITLIFAGLTARPFFAAELPRSCNGSSASPYSKACPRALRKRGRVPAYTLDGCLLLYSVLLVTRFDL
jgi:hypothetical protein